MALWRGNLHLRIKEIHDAYGSVVRIAPDELSFIEGSAWQDIYTGGTGNKGFPKHKAYRNAQGFESLFDATDDNHTRLRKLLTNSFFSPASVNKQEQIIQDYTNILVQRLRIHIRNDDEISIALNIQEWFNFATFDIAGSLTLSEDFGCLKGLTYHPWILMVLTHFKMSALVMCLRLYAPLDTLMLHFTPSKLSKLKDKFLRLVREKIERRLSEEGVSEHNDFVSAALKSPKSGGMNKEELEANCILMILAGSETMATSLISATNFLCKNPSALRKLATELRVFQREGDLRLSKIKHLPYLNAVIKETHRLSPPLSNGPSRVVGPRDTIICGHHIPTGTAVSVTQYAANRSATNFTLPDQFIPERWLTQQDSGLYVNDNRNVVRPFSIGSRDCLGQNFAIAEFLIVLARMVWNFDMTPVSELVWENQKAYMLWAKEPYLVKLKLAHRG